MTKIKPIKTKRDYSKIISIISMVVAFISIIVTTVFIDIKPQPKESKKDSIVDCSTLGEYKNLVLAEDVAYMPIYSEQIEFLEVTEQSIMLVTENDIIVFDKTHYNSKILFNSPKILLIKNGKLKRLK